METHRFILTLGSNHQSEKHLPEALTALQAHPGLSLRHSSPISGPALDMPPTAHPFTDIVAVGETALPLEALYTLLKGLERTAGRTPELRHSQPTCIPLDLDLVLWDQLVLKPKDLSRPYVEVGLRELGLSREVLTAPQHPQPAS